MHDPILIGIHGVKRAGKDTTASFITDWAGEQSPVLSVRRRGFADKAKWAFARQFFPGISMDDALEWVDKFKEGTARFYYPDPFVSPEIDWEYQSQHFRDVMAQFATDGARDIYGDDFWVDQLLPMTQHFPFDISDPKYQHRVGYPHWWEEFKHEFGLCAWRPPDADPLEPVQVADICLITDLRFPNEVKRIHKLQGYCFKIKRKDAEDEVIQQARERGREVHRSELGIPDDFFDAVIDNSDNDMDKARERTVDALQRIERVEAHVKA